MSESPYSQLVVFLEGPDDSRFWDAVIRPLLKDRYDCIIPWTYASEPTHRIASFLKHVQSMGSDYIFVSDYDRYPCITSRKYKLRERLPDLESERIVIVVEEIESWYLSGLDDYVGKRRFRIAPMASTDNVTKEQFLSLFGSKYSSRIDLLIEILKNFDLRSAASKNRSFRYCLNQLQLSL